MSYRIFCYNTCIVFPKGGEVLCYSSIAEVQVTQGYFTKFGEKIG